MTDNYKITLSSSGKTFEISPSSGAHLIEGGLGGFYSAGFDVSVAPYAAENGGYAQKRRFAERELSITFEIEHSLSGVLRQKLGSMLSPKEDCIISVILGDVERKITAIPCDEPVFSETVFGEPTEVTLHFIAPSVFFEQSDGVVSRLRERVGLLTFPMNFTVDGGLTAGIFISNASLKIVNPGDTECGLVITISADDGDVVNPKISLGDKFVLCPLTLSDGDTLVIDTRTRRKNIYLNGVRCFTFDKHSTFFSLPTGESTVSFTADSGEEYAEAVVDFTPLYNGV